MSKGLVKRFGVLGDTEMGGGIGPSRLIWEMIVRLLADINKYRCTWALCC